MTLVCEAEQSESIEWRKLSSTSNCYLFPYEATTPSFGFMVKNKINQCQTRERKGQDLFMIMILLLDLAGYLTYNSIPEMTQSGPRPKVLIQSSD